MMTGINFSLYEAYFQKGKFSKLKMLGCTPRTRIANKISFNLQHPELTELILDLETGYPYELNFLCPKLQALSIDVGIIINWYFVTQVLEERSRMPGIQKSIENSKKSLQKFRYYYKGSTPLIPTSQKGNEDELSIISQCSNLTEVIKCMDSLILCSSTSVMELKEELKHSITSWQTIVPFIWRN